MESDNRDVLSKILKYFDSYIFPEWHNLAQIQERVLPEQKLDYGTIRRSLEKLQEQGFVSVTNINDDDKLSVRITAKGKNKIMNEKNKRIFAILQYVNQSNIRRNNNLEESAIATQFDFTKADFSEAFNEMKEKAYVELRENQRGYKIAQDGEIKLNELTLEYGEPGKTKNAKTSKEKETILGLPIAIFWTFMAILFSAIFSAGYFVGKNQKSKEDAMLQLRYETLLDSLSSSNGFVEPTEKQEKTNTSTTGHDSIYKNH